MARDNEAGLIVLRWFSAELHLPPQQVKVGDASRTQIHFREDATTPRLSGTLSKSGNSG